MYLQLNGYKLYYELAGPENSLPVVFIHGFPFSSQMWQGQTDALKDRFQTLVYDVRGHGKSGSGAPFFTIDFFAEELNSLLEACGIQKAVICGLSMGGYIALRFAEMYPDKLHGLVLCDTRSEADTNEAKTNRARQICILQTEGKEKFADGTLPSLLSEAHINPEDEVYQFVHDMILQNEVEGICATLLALAARPDTTASLEKISIPTLILVGENDKLTPPDAAERLHNNIKGSRLHKIPDAAHLSNLENSEDFNAKLTDFLHSLS
jgi:3-oxoadipate enol-lactonase